MRLLLDTHALLWFLSGDEKLERSARALVEDEGNEVLVSRDPVFDAYGVHRLWSTGH